MIIDELSQHLQGDIGTSHTTILTLINVTLIPTIELNVVN